MSAAALDADTFSKEMHRNGWECSWCKEMDSLGLMVLPESPYHLIPLSYSVCPRDATTILPNGDETVVGCGGSITMTIGISFANTLQFQVTSAAAIHSSPLHRGAKSASSPL